MNKINWKEVWNTLEECICTDKNEGKESSIEETRKYVEWIVEKQLRSRYARIS